MTAWAQQQIERQRNERAEYAAACWRLADEHRGDGDIKSIEASAMRAEDEAARMGRALNL
jgi:hypothetical protein